MTVKPCDLPPSHSLWKHPLFADPAVYPAEHGRLAAAWLDARIRRLRRMPSTHNRAADEALTATQAIYESFKRHLHKPRARRCFLPVPTQVELLLRISTMTEALQGEHVSREHILTFDRLVPVLRQQNLMPEILPENATLYDAVGRLHTAERLLLDRILLADPTLRRAYLRRLYKALDCALDYNSTADTVRITPVLAWIAERWKNRAAGAYVDVGCSVATGAENTRLAARILRPCGLAIIHGVDIVPPSAALQQRMLNNERIALYQADAIRRPLPRRYDIILLANVHRHLTREDQRHMLVNLMHSLAPSGELFVNWRFDAGNSPALCLCNQGSNVHVAEERNCATMPDF